MNDEQAKQLRAPFPPESIGKLPRVWCGACRKIIKERRGTNCNEHQKAKCSACGSNMTTAHLHLDYVGHAETTDRLLQVDPEWDWQPVSFSSETGLPQTDRHGGLWIRLTVAGVTRLGYGHADGKEGADAVKEAIGDALRNAAMRFGVALDLWSKSGNAETSSPAVGAGQPARQAEARQQPKGTPADAAKAVLRNRAKAMGLDLEMVAKEYEARAKTPLKDETRADWVEKFVAGLADGTIKIPAAAGAS